MSQTLKKFLVILTCLSNGTNRFSDICKESGFPPGTVHRLLNSMMDLGLVLQDPLHRLYYLGPTIFSIASNQLNAHQRLILSARNELKELQNITNETTALHALMGVYQTCLDEHVSSEPIRFTIGIGAIGLASTGASGKVLLSQLSDDLLNDLKKKYLILNRNSKDKIDLSVFEQIFSIRRDGFAETMGERQHGAMAISAPIKNYFCPLSLSVMGPENRIAQKRDSVIRLVKKSAKQISSDLLNLNE